MAHMTSISVSDLLPWSSSNVTPLRPVAYAHSLSSAERASPIPLRDTVSFDMIRRRYASPPGKFIVEPSRRKEAQLDSSPHRTETQETKTSAWDRFFGKSTPPLEIDLTEPDAAPTQDLEQDNFYSNIETRKVESYPKGSIVQLSAFLDSDDSLCMVRRFGTETLRLIQFKEIELDLLAREIDAIDQRDAIFAANTGYRLNSIEHHDGWPAELSDSLQLFEEKIKVYYDLVLKFVEIRALEPPTKAQYNNVCNWMTRNKPICGEERKTMLRQDDFVTTRKCQPNNRKNGLEDYLESWLVKDPRSGLNGWVQRWLLQGKAELDKTEDPFVHHISASSFARLVRVLLTIFVIATMLLPVFIIVLVQPKREIMVSVVAVFVTVVMVSISLVIDISAQEVFLGMAAYSAVLVALLSMNNGGCGCPA